MFSAKLAGLSFNDANKLRGRLQQDIYPQLRVEPRYGKNINKLSDMDKIDKEVWRYKLEIFRIFYTLSKDNGTIYMLTLDTRY